MKEGWIPVSAGITEKRRLYYRSPRACPSREGPVEGSPLKGRSWFDGLTTNGWYALPHAKNNLQSAIRISNFAVKHEMRMLKK